MQAQPPIRNLGEILSENLGRKVEVVTQSSKYLTAPGDNYGSTMLALETKIKDAKSGQEEDLHLVAKMIPPAEELFLIFQTPLTFKKENDMYSVTGPALRQFEREMGVPDDELLDVLPKCYGSRVSLNPPGSPLDSDALLLLENLKNTGYTIADRLVGFDEKETKLVLKNLAHFHAVPIAVRIHKPEIFTEKVLPTLTPLAHVADDAANSDWKEATLDILRLFPDTLLYIDKARVLIESDNVMRTSSKHTPTPKEPFASINHNDFWVNNMMLKYDENQTPIKVKFVDFQVALYDSVVHDLLFLLFSSVQDTIRDCKYQEFIEYYHKHLTGYLKTLNCNVEDFSFDKFEKEIEEQAPRVFAKVILMSKVIMTQKEDAMELSEFKGSDFFLSSGGRAHNQKVRGIVLQFVKRKWL